MDSVHDQIRRHLLESAGMFISPGPGEMPALKDLEKTEWSPEFEKLMRNRMIMGAFRYGSLGQADKPKYNKIDSIRQRLELYEQGGNAEHLVDIANLCLVEFVDESHPNFHWRAQDDSDHAKAI